jgi:hypothetical protein
MRRRHQKKRGRKLYSIGGQFSVGVNDM